MIYEFNCQLYRHWLTGLKYNELDAILIFPKEFSNLSKAYAKLIFGKAESMSMQ